MSFVTFIKFILLDIIANVSKNISEVPNPKVKRELLEHQALLTCKLLLDNRPMYKQMQA